MNNIPNDVEKAAFDVGFEKDIEKSSASYMHVDHSTVLSFLNSKYKDKLEILDICLALEKYDWLHEYYWSLVDKEKDKYTKDAQDISGGYFIRIFKGCKIDIPLQACLTLSKSNTKQKVHNIILLEEESEANIISGCSICPDINESEHIGISEIFVKRKAKLNFTMIHNWSKSTKVRPRSVVLLEEDASFISNYILMSHVKDLQMYPEAICEGDNSEAVFNNIIYGKGSSLIDIGSKIVLNGKNSNAQSISKVVASDNSKIFARGILEGNQDKIKAHLECRGIIVNDNASIHAIPELIGNRKDIKMSHEAAVGKIADKEITYLMSRGLSKDEAISLIIRGFLSVDLMHLPQRIKTSIDMLVSQLVESF